MTRQEGFKWLALIVYYPATKHVDVWGRGPSKIAALNNAQTAAANAHPEFDEVSHSFYGGKIGWYCKLLIAVPK